MASEYTAPEQIALEIVEHSPSIAMRVSRAGGKLKTCFISENINMYGYSKKEFLNGKLAWEDIVHPDDIEILRLKMNEYEQSETSCYTLLYRIIHKSGISSWVSDNTNVIKDEDGNVLYYDCVIADNTKTKEAQNKIKENADQQIILNKILQSLHNTDFDESIQTIFKLVGNYLNVSRIVMFADTPDHSACNAVQEWCNTGINYITRKRLLRLDYEQDFLEVMQVLDKENIYIAHKAEFKGVSKKTLEKDNVETVVAITIDLPDDRYGFIRFDDCANNRIWEADTLIFLQTISQLVSTALIKKMSAQAIEHMAYYDPLTGLTNRYRFEFCLQSSIEEARLSGTIGYVLFIDMDDFKVINDGYGHHYGDALLVEVANFFEKQFENEAKIFRFGGDEFLVLVNNPPSGEIQNMIGRILERGRHPWEVLEKTFYCTLSMGVVRYPDGDSCVKDIVRNADIALHQAKEQGKNSYSVYRHTFDNESVVRAEMEHRMRKAIENNFEDFEVYFQPLVIPSGKILGAEALLRWKTPSGKMMLPGNFVPLAEYLGLIIPLGEFVLRKAAKVCYEVNKIDPSFYISVNVSIRQFQQPGFVSRTKEILLRSKVKPSNIILEVTEGQAATDMQQMKYIMSELRTAGVRVAMDDFGTGYSSLSNMRELPLDMIKIDKSFVEDINEDAYSQSFVRFITELSHSMNRIVCVEGVETREQLLYCTKCGTDSIQGFYFWKPMPMEELLKSVEAGHI